LHTAIVAVQKVREDLSALDRSTGCLEEGGLPGIERRSSPK
jgi:hypothetical protein